MEKNTISDQIYSMICHHQTEDGGNKFVLADCPLQQGLQHKISQWGQGYICNSCCQLIKKGCNLTIDNKTQCLQCKGAEYLQQFVTSRQICQHDKASIGKVRLQCITSDNQLYHDLDLGGKLICLDCQKKLIFKYQAQQQCKICSNKTKQLLTNLKGSLANQQIRIIKKLLLVLAQKKCSDTIKIQIQNHCNKKLTKQTVAKHQKQCKIKDLPDFIKQIQQLNHKQSKYLYYSKCQKHKGTPIKVCSTCITVLLNINVCPFGCDIKAISSNVKQSKGKTSYQTGFIIFSPVPNLKKKQGEANYYLQMINFQNIVIKNKFDQMQIQQKQIYQSKDSQISQNQYPLFGSITALSPSKYVLSGGLLKVSGAQNITNNTWLFQISKNKNTYNFTSKKLAPMNTPRAGHYLGQFNGYIFAIGGYNQKGYLNACQKYIIKQNKWVNTVSLNYARSKPTAFVRTNQANNQLVIFGGLSIQPEVFNYAQILTVEQNKWKILSQQTDRYDQYSPLTGSVASVRNENLSKFKNLLLFGGSNYADFSQNIYSLVVQEKNFKLNQISCKLQSKRAFSQIGVLQTSENNQKKIILFGGGLEHESILNIEVILCEIKDQNLVPVFANKISSTVYGDILKYQKSNQYKFIKKELEDKGILNGKKLKAGKQNQQINEHLLETLWLWGKSIVNYVPEKQK